MHPSPDRPQRSALTDIESRISVLERRLKNARSARDSYVDYLRGKYPHWKPSLPTYSRQLKSDEHIVSQLSTSAYHWEGSRPTIVRPPPPPANFYHQIPQRGPFLESDFARTRDRLNVMSQQLRVLRDARLNMTTDEYFRARAARAGREGISFEEEEVPSLEGVRKRLADMSFSLMEPPSTPTQETIDEMKRLEQREKMIQNIKSGVLPSVVNIQSGPSFIFPEPKEEPPKVAEPPKPLQETTQPRIQFVETKPPAPEPKPEPVPPAQKPGASAYSKMLSLLTKTDSTDSDEIQPPVKQAPPKAQTPKKEEPKPMLGSLSQYLQKSTASKSATPARKASEPDSDSDFFD